MKPRGYFGIGIVSGKTPQNLGTLWRHALIYNAAFIFTIGKRYKKQGSDTIKAIRHLPLFSYLTFDEFYNNLPYNVQLIGVETDSNRRYLRNQKHPERAIYLLGSEDKGLSDYITNRCHSLVSIESALPHSLNVATAGTIVMYDRFIKRGL